MTEHNLPDKDDAPWMDTTYDGFNEEQALKSLGFDYGCDRSREESIPLGTLADMTIQELVNLIRPDDD